MPWCVPTQLPVSIAVSLASKHIKLTKLLSEHLKGSLYTISWQKLGQLRDTRNS